MKKRVAVLVVAVAILAFVGLRWSDEFDPSSLRDKVVLITGASTGIGEQLAYQYASTGATLILTARRQQVLLQVASRCRQLGSSRVEIIAGDMGDASHRLAVVNRTRHLFERLDYLILNHMINNYHFWIDGDNDANQAELELFLRVNLMAYVDLASRSMDLLSKSAGSIAVLSSVAGKIGWPTIAAYSTTKFGLEGFFGSLRQELIYHRRNITVTTCVLGLVGTQSTLDAVRDKYTHGAKVNGYIHQPKDVAAAILKSVSLKKSVLYYPSSLYWLFFGHFVFPGLFDWYIRDEMCGRFAQDISA